MFRVETTAEFDRWLDGLRDRQAKAKVATRIVRIEAGLLGDWKPVGGGVSELRIDHGPGYRLYYTLREQVIVLLLCGSDKRDQEKAIRLAKDLARKLQ
jgi:putative addiction module killer protein